MGAGGIAVAPVTAPLPDVAVPDVQLTADEEQINLDIMRHANVLGPQNTVGSFLPGFSLSPTGLQQAQDVRDALAPEGPYAGIDAGENIRMPETAQPLAEALGMDVQTLPGLNEISGGIYNYDPILSPGGILYELTLAAWIAGFEFVPMPGANYLNGVAFDESFGHAVETIYQNTVSGADPTKDVAVSGGAAITGWTLMNVKNPDLATLFSIFLETVRSGGLDGFLPEAGVVVVRGDPEDGWTLVSFNGHPFPQDPGLLTELFVDVRNVITPPQTAAYNIAEAVLASDPTKIESAIQAGVSDVGAAIVQFPQSVITDIIGAFGDVTAAAGQLTGETLSDLLTSLI